MAEIKEMMIEELEERKLAIKEEINEPEADLDALEEEARAINEELETRAKEEAEKVEERKAVAEGKDTIEIETIEEREEVKTDMEIRNSKEYINAYANYIKTGNDKECRALTTGDVPVPQLVYDRIGTAWEKDDILSRVRKSYIKGILKVGFEASSSPAEIHEEGGDPVTEEELVLGIATLTPMSIKKWISISDEVYDLTGEAFLDYIYDELTYRIAHLAAQMVVGTIEAAPATSSSTAAGVPQLPVTALAQDTIAQAIALLSDEASNPVAIMSKGTWAEFKGVQYAGQFATDIFEGLPVLFTDNFDSFTDTADTEPFAIVGDLNKFLVNFPAGEDIDIKFDDKTLMTSDLIRILGRMYAGFAVTAPNCFVNLIKSE